MDTTAQDSSGYLLKETVKTGTAQYPENTQGLNEGMLKLENRIFADTGGVSRANRDKGFISAFRDSANGRVYRSRFADGRPAPVHILDGLPNEVILSRDASGRITAVKPSVESGFEQAGHFYTRGEVAQLMSKRGAVFA